MRSLLSMLLLLCLFAGLAGAQYHNPVYIFGSGKPSTSTLYLQGAYILDNTGPSPAVTQMFQTGYNGYAVLMDVDNKHIVFTVEGTTSTSTLYGEPKEGLFCYDPSTRMITTIWRAPAAWVLAARPACRLGASMLRAVLAGFPIVLLYRRETLPRRRRP